MATPPVCRIMDYGKFRYEESQKAKESRKKTLQVSIKEVKFKPKIGKGDFDTKVRHLREFLEDGHKVKVTLQFRGREMAHPELGTKIINAVIEELGSSAKVEAYARLEGRNMTMVLAPDKKIVKKSEHKYDKLDLPADAEPEVAEAGPEVTEAAETEAADVTEPEVAGAEVTGAEVAGAEVAGAEVAGPDAAGPEVTEPADPT